jgi:predicted ATP-grasp superfamily ATP-dependent carboligase
MLAVGAASLRSLTGGKASGRAGVRRVLVTDGQERCAIAAMRSLHAAGLHVTASAPAGASPAPGLWSRACSQRLRTPSPVDDPDGFAAAIEAALADSPHETVLAGGDAALLALSRRRERIESLLSLGLALPPHEAVAAATDKTALLAAAEQAGLPCAPTALCSSAAEVLAASDELGYPVVVKPVSSVYEQHGHLRQEPGRAAGSRAEVEELVPRYGGRCIVQRAETGQVHSVGGVAAGGRMLGLCVSRYLRTWPPAGGNAAFSESIEPPQGLSERVLALLEAIGWEGIFELELLRRADGSFVSLDLNPRVYGSMALALRAGADLPALWLRHLHGERPEPQVARPGLRYRWEDAEMRRVGFELRHGHPLGAAGVARPRRRTVHPHLQAGDPGPFAARLAYLARRMASGRRGEEVKPGGAGADREGAPMTATAARAAGHGPSSNGAPDVRVAVIGAGPHGLGVAAHLNGADVIVFGEPMEFWRTRMPTGMMLRSAPRASSIGHPGRDLTIQRWGETEGREVLNPVPIGDFLDYAAWFERQAVPGVDRRKVSRVERSGQGFRLQLEDGEELTAEKVVVSAGVASFAHVPDELRDFPPELVSHAYDHRDLGRFAGRSVIVLGSGQSALEYAALLHEEGAEVEVIARAPSIIWISPPRNDRRIYWPIAPTDVGGRVTSWLAAAPDVFRRLPRRAQPGLAYRAIRPMGAWWLPDRLRDVPINLGLSIASADAHDGRLRLALSDGSERIVDHVLLGTGYQVDVRSYSFLAPELAAEVDVVAGYPRLRSGLESSVPGLHFVGAPAAYSFGPVMRFVTGSWYAAPAVARRVAGRRQPPLRWSF